MRLATFLAPGGDTPTAGEVRGDEVVAFASGTVLDRLASGDRTPAGGAAYRARRGRRCSRPSRARGRSSASGSTTSRTPARPGKEPPEAPIVFMKLPTSSVGPGRPGALPRGRAAARLRGRARARDGRRERDRRATPSPTTSPRATCRSASRSGRARRAPTRSARGARGSPPPTTVPDAGDLRLTCHVNGELRQDSRTSDLIFGPRALVDFIAEAITLEPGDLILTGTPCGRRPGDGPAAVPGVRRRRALRDRGARGDRAPDRLVVTRAPGRSARTRRPARR